MQNSFQFLHPDVPRRPAPHDQHPSYATFVASRKGRCIAGQKNPDPSDDASTSSRWPSLLNYSFDIVTIALIAEIFPAQNTLSEL